MITKLPLRELEKRNKAVKDSNKDAADVAAVIFMTNWMKKKGVTQEKLLDLGVWSDSEKQHIDRIYKYSY